VRAPVHESQLKEESLFNKGVSIIKEKIENARNKARDNYWKESPIDKI